MTRNFIEAKERYLSVIEELSHIADIIKQAERNGSDIQFDRKIFMCQFDSLLQYSLLEYAINDDYLDYDELTFIKDITKYADFISYINSHYENSITWDDIYHANETSIRDWLLRNRVYMDNIKEQFALSFALVDGLDRDPDLIEHFTKDIFQIFAALAREDGYVSSEEKQLTDNYISSVIIEMYAAFRFISEKVGDVNSGRNENSKPDSLKSLYQNKVKKN